MYNVTPSFVSILVYALHYSSSSVYYYHYYYYYYCYCCCYYYYYYYDYASDNDDYYGVDLKRPATKSGHPCLVPGSAGFTSSTTSCSLWKTGPLGPWLHWPRNCLQNKGKLRGGV